MNRDGVPEVVWALACWRNNLAWYAIRMGGDLYSTPEDARIACATCLAKGQDGKCMYALRDREPVRLWPQGGEPCPSSACCE